MRKMATTASAARTARAPPGEGEGDRRPAGERAPRRLHLLWLLVLLWPLPQPGADAHTEDVAAPDFYAEIRDLLNQRLALQEEFSWAPRPREIPGWPGPLPWLGEVSGVSVRPDGNPVLFHRGPRVWDARSFNSSERYQRVSEGPIAVETVVTLHRVTGDPVDAWGRGIFYLPHGITVDSFGYTWLTDVALHQVFKFPPGGGQRPELALGERFIPGSDAHHFCKPTSVAVARTGQVFVADGYCNSRVLEFNKRGRLLRELPMPEGLSPLRVPHALTLLEGTDLLCVADRENRRVVCPAAGLRVGDPPAGDALAAAIVHPPDLGRVYGIAARGDAVYAVNGPTSRHIPVRGFTLDPQSEEVMDRWGPVPGFTSPHGMAICPSGRSLYVVELAPPRVLKFDLRPPMRSRRSPKG